jgi:hypothetical protein
MRWPTKPWGKKAVNLKVDPSDSSLWAGYNMRPTGDDVLADQSVNGYDLARTPGPISLQSILGDAMQFGGVGNWVTAAPDDTFTALTIELWWRPRAGVVNSSRILEVGQNDVELITGQLGTAVYVKINNNNAYIQNDGIQTESWHHVVITYTNGVGGSMYIDGALAATSAISNEGNLTAFTDLTIGSDYTNTLNTEGDLLRPCIYSEVKDANWVAKRYKEGAQAVQFKTDWGCLETVSNVTSGSITNTPVKVDSGTWSLGTDAIPGSSEEGEEVLTDGDMEAVGTGSWSPTTATLSKETSDLSGSTQCLRITSTGTTGQAKQNVLTADINYRISGYARGDGTGYPRIYFGSGVYPWTGTTSTSWQYFDVVASNTSNYFSLICAGGSGLYVEFDNVSVKRIEKDIKVLTCESAGICYIPTEIFAIDAPEEAAYGTWDFWVNRATGAFRIGIGSEIDPTALGNYRIEGTITPRFRVVESAVTVLQEEDIVYPSNTWGHFKITRSYNGDFRGYFNDTLIIDSANDTTITSSAYLGIELSTGGKIALGALNGSNSITKYLGVV